MLFNNNRDRFTLYGFLVGLAFPLITFVSIVYITQSIWFPFALICTAPFFLGLYSRFSGVRQDKLNEINIGLERIIEDRTSAIKNMLDVSGQGFLSFGPDLKIKGNFSKKCNELLDKNISGKKINEILFEDDEKVNDFKDGFFLFFNGKARGEVIFDLMEKETLIKGKNVKVEYRIISENEVLCILTDITVEKVLNQKLKKDDDNRNIILQVISHQKYFASFVQEANHLFQFMSLIDKDGLKKDFDKLQRDLHTFKGNASFFSFIHTKETAHELEFYINDCLILEEDINLGEQSVVLKRYFFNELKVIQDTFGDHWIENIGNVTIPHHNYLKLEEYIEKKYSHDVNLKTAIKHFRKVPFHNMFAQFPDMTSRLAETLGKRIEPVSIDGGHMQILPERYDLLVKSFVHLIRNMVDHGIETPREREIQNKSSRGNISIEIKNINEAIEISFSDDGKGISLAAIEKKAREKGMIHDEVTLNPGELIRLIFSHDFSTASHISDISGRGAGLSAVKAEVDKLKGRISVTTRQNQGTTFKILLPEIT